MPPVGFEPTISAGERPQTYALDRAASGTGILTNTCLFFLWRCDPTRVMASSFLGFLDHTQRRTTVGRTLPDNTQHSQQTDFHAPCGIRTHDLSRRAAANLCLRPLGHWDRHTHEYLAVLTLRRLMSYIYGAPILDVSRSHTTTQHSR